MNPPTSPTCPQCGSVLPSDAPKGLCPRCLGALNLAPETAFTGEGVGPHGAKIIPPKPPLTPEELAPLFPQLELLECLGRGGMGVVYKARQKTLNRFVALKLLAPERVADAKFGERFTREAQALAALNHPNIVTIHDFGLTAATLTSHPSTLSAATATAPATSFYFLLMEFVDGVNLRQAMSAGRFTPEQALAVVPPVCEALQYAHEHGIVHRDIKPENLLLDKTGRVKIADFGIAKILEANGGAGSPLPAAEGAHGVTRPTPYETFAESAAGTPQYMAPEQREHQRTDHRADIYSLGVVLYEMLTGELPAAKLQPPSRKVQIDVRLDEIVLRALETKPELRFQTAGEMRTQIETFTSTPRASRGDAEQPTGKGQSLLASAPTIGGAGFRKLGSGFLFPLEQFATFAGQFYVCRMRGQLLLDDRQLTHSRAGINTVIPLAAIRDLSLGKYPRSINLAGLDLLSVTYEEGGQSRQVLVSPMNGWIGFPTDFNALAAEWFAAIRDAVIAATGRTPATTPAEKLHLPQGSVWPMVAFVAVPLPLGVGLLAFFDFIRLMVTNSARPGELVGQAAVVLMAVAALALIVTWLLRRTTGVGGTPAPGHGPRSWKFVGLVMLILPLVFLGVLLLKFSRGVDSLPPRDRAHFQSAPVGRSNPIAVVVSRDKAVVNQRHFAGEGMILTFGTQTNRWTPGGRELDAMFDINLESGWFVRGVNWVVKSRRGTTHLYRLDGPSGSRVGKLAFHPGTPAPAADGSYVIGEFRPEFGAALPIAVRLEKDEPSHAAAMAQTNSLPKQPEKTSQPTHGHYGFGSARSINLGVLIFLGNVFLVGLALVVWLLRKGGTAGKLVASGLSGLLLGLLGVMALLGSVWTKTGTGFPMFDRMELAPLMTLLGGVVMGGIALVVWLLRKGGTAGKHVASGLSGLLLAVLVVMALLGGLSAKAGMGFVKFERMELGPLAATGERAAQHDTIGWQLRLDEREGERTNHLWFWSVRATGHGGLARPQLPDHGTNFTHRLAHNETLEWWQLALPANVTLNPGEQRDIPLFRTLGSATATGEFPREARVCVRCAPAPLELEPTSREPLIELGLAAHTRLAKADSSAAIPADATRGAATEIFRNKRQPVTMTVPATEKSAEATPHPRTTPVSVTNGGAAGIP